MVIGLGILGNVEVRRKMDFRSSALLRAAQFVGPLPTEKRYTASVSVFLVTGECIGYNVLIQANIASDDGRDLKKHEASTA